MRVGARPLDLRHDAHQAAGVDSAVTREPRAVDDHELRVLASDRAPVLFEDLNPVCPGSRIAGGAPRQRAEHLFNGEESGNDRVNTLVRVRKCTRELAEV